MTPATTTRTERLMRKAAEICMQITGRNHVSDDLLCSVFQSLDLEDYQNKNEEPPQTVGICH
ncbi:hypothetical protein EV686_106185 [Paracandidimonas soli]|uniref:Uncharacterized protein n=1 Tax=Paracandidimonas soli TaxID=1917182 RepID=A0A4R3V1E3_9BURK|nr:hypothetical protein EV686_106185 [Paracandidimonas soli]